MKRITLILSALTFVAMSFHMQAQQNWQEWNASGQYKNYIPTGMPILLIAPDAISSSLGDAGVASNPDAYSSHWNNAKYAFVEDNASISTTYSPWLSNLQVADMNLLYLAGYKKINSRSAVGASLEYFSLGDLTQTDVDGREVSQFYPNEFALDVTYAMKLSDNFSIGATGRYIRSDLTNGLNVDGQATHAANALAADLGFYYQGKIDQQQTLALGAHISNLGSKLRYADDGSSEFLPANFRIGGRYTYEIDDYNKISALVDVNKLLVPTPGVMVDGEYISDYYDSRADYESTGSMQGVLQSFFDAPGGIREELREIQASVGAEYWYANTFAARLGYFYENKNKGGRQYLTVGAAFKYNVFVFDLSYLVPTTMFSQNPLANTIRISLTMDFKSSKK